MDEIELIPNKAEFRVKIVEFENSCKEINGYIEGEEKDKFNPLKHTFVNGLYVREILMPAGQLIITKIHKVEHPFFIVKGKVSILSENGIQYIEAPYSGITKPGTKRIMYTHEDTILITVHATDKKTPEEVEEDVIAKNFEDPVISLEEINLLKQTQ